MEPFNLTQVEHSQNSFTDSLLQVINAFNTGFEPDRMLNLILEQIHSTVPFELAFIGFIEGKSIQVAVIQGYDEVPGCSPAVGAVIPLDQYPLLMQAIATHQPMLTVNGVEHNGRQAILGTEWAQSEAAVPLISGREAIGVIYLSIRTTGIYTPEVLDQLLAFAGLAGLTLDVLRLKKAETTARQIAVTLSAAAEALMNTSDIEILIDTLLEHLQMIIQPDVASVTLFVNETQPALRITKGYGAWADRDTIPFLLPNRIPELSIERIKTGHKSLSITSSMNGSTHAGEDQILHWLVVPVIASGKISGRVDLGKTREGSFSQEQIRWTEALVAQSGVAIQNKRLLEQVRSSRERLQIVTRKLVEIQEKERSYVARELHDEAGQLLSSLKISLSRLEQDPACPPSIQKRLQGIKSTADSVLENLHRLAMDLRPAILDHLGLVAALEDYTSNLNSEQLSVQFKAVRFEGKRLPPDLEVCFFRIVQEALTNVVRHARASNVGVLLEWDEGKIKIFIEDNGVGFSPDQIDKKEHIGLLSMRERAEIIDGKLSIESSPEKGTTIIVEAPDGYSGSHSR